MGNGDAKKLQVLQGGASSSDGGEVDQQEFQKLLEFYDTSFRNIAEGEVVKGRVVKVTPTSRYSEAAQRVHASSAALEAT